MRFEPQMPKLISAIFPSVIGFEIDHLEGRVQPVEYEDGRGRKANEWPPVARWRVGEQRFRYVLKPTFRAERWGVLCFGGTVVRADYSGEEEKLWQLLQWSAEGKTTDEMNRLIGNEKPTGT